MNQFTDISLFGVIFFSVACGWAIGHFKGVIAGYNHAKAEEQEGYPIANIYFYSTDNEDQFSFVDMATGEFVFAGTMEDCAKELRKGNPAKKIVFSIGDEDDDEEETDGQPV